MVMPPWYNAHTPGGISTQRAGNSGMLYISACFRKKHNKIQMHNYNRWPRALSFFHLLRIFSVCRLLLSHAHGTIQSWVNYNVTPATKQYAYHQKTRIPRRGCMFNNHEQLSSWQGHTLLDNQEPKERLPWCEQWVWCKPGWPKKLETYHFKSFFVVRFDKYIRRLLAKTHNCKQVFKPNKVFCQIR